MKAKNSLFLILLFVIVGPLAIAVLSGCFVPDKYFLYGYECSAESFYLVSIVPLIGGIVLVYLNRTKGFRSKIWYVIGGAVILITGLNLLALTSLSNFGF